MPSLAARHQPDPNAGFEPDPHRPTSIGAPSWVPTPGQADALDWLHRSRPRLDGMPRPGSGATAVRFRRLADLARVDLARARLAEGHVDAIAILDELGRAELAGTATWGVWAARPGDLRAARTATGWHLEGEKAWCSGASGLERALVTAAAVDGPRLFVVDPAELEVVPGTWQPVGMQDTASFTLRFDIALPERSAVGRPSAYVERAGFWHGGVGVAACWLGGAHAVAERLGEALRERDDPYLAATYGRVRSRLDAAEAWLERGSEAIDAEPYDVVQARRRAQSIRLAVDDAARAALAETTNALGAGSLCHDPAHARRVADLGVYLRQLHFDKDAAAYGREVAGVAPAW